MCGIIFGIDPTGPVSLRENAKRVRHRGPDWSSEWSTPDKKIVAAHERLAIINPTSGEQPIFSDDGQIVLVVNGEIYNYETLTNKPNITDCYGILAAYEDAADIVHACQSLDGDFAFVLFDRTKNKIVAARDTMGVCPLYIGFNVETKALWFSSELKGLPHDVSGFQQFPPGHCVEFDVANVSDFVDQLTFALTPEDCHTRPPFRLFAFDWLTMQSPKSTLVFNDESTLFNSIRSGLEIAVEKRLMSDVPFGVLLSGGLDSSLVAAIAARKLKLNARTQNWGNQLRTFSVGMTGSPDIAAAEKVAKHIGSDHYSFTFTFEDGLRALEDVIYSIETYDVTTIRSSVPMFLMAKRIKSLGVKTVLSGEGADESFAGYLYFHKAPSPEELWKETVRKMFYLHHYDVLRANKAMMAAGVETRVPFLDAAYLNFNFRHIPPHLKMVTKERPIEKWLLRKSFDFDNYLPSSVLWRGKEQFSDGVGFGWIDRLKAHAEHIVSDSQFAKRTFLYPFQTPTTKEGFWYRTIFERKFSNFQMFRYNERAIFTEPSIACSTKKALEWEEAWADSNLHDPSGRLIDVHEFSIGNKKSRSESDTLDSAT